MRLSVFNCSVCGPIGGEEDWVQHLVCNRHLRRCRRHFDSTGWSEDAKMRSLLLFSNFPLVSGSLEDGGSGGYQQDIAAVVTLLQKCSNGKGGALRNFLGWSEKPLLGFLQFSSPNAMKRGLGNLKAKRQGPIFEVKLYEEHLLEVRKVCEMGKIELAMHIPEQRILPQRESSPIPVQDYQEENDNSLDELEILEAEEDPSSFPAVEVDLENEETGLEEDVIGVRKEIKIKPELKVPSRPSLPECFVVLNRVSICSKHKAPNSPAITSDPDKVNQTSARTISEKLCRRSERISTKSVPTTNNS